MWRISGLFIVVHIPKKEQSGNRYSLKRLRQADREDVFLTLSFIIQQDTDLTNNEQIKAEQNTAPTSHLYLTSHIPNKTEDITVLINHSNIIIIELINILYVEKYMYPLKNIAMCCLNLNDISNHLYVCH